MEDQQRHEVIDSKYCEHDGIVLAVVKKVLPQTDSSIIVADSNNNILFKINPIPTIFKLNKKRVLVDVNDDNRVILTFRNKWSLHGRWSVHKGKSKSSDDLLFTAKLRSMFSWKSRLEVFLPGNTTEQACDFKVASETRDRFFAGNNENEQDVIAQTYEHMVTVNGRVDYAFIVSLIAILDGMNELRNQQRSEGESSVAAGLNLAGALAS